MGKRKTDYIFAPEKPKSSHLGCTFTALALILAVAMAAVLFNMAANKRVELKEEKVSVMALDKAFEGFTVLHISDMHASPLGDDLDLWRTLLYSKSFQAVVLTGDMVGTGGDFEPLLSLIHTLQQLSPNAPIYFVAGDDDPAPVNYVPIGCAPRSSSARSIWMRPLRSRWASARSGSFRKSCMIWMRRACWVP